MRILPCKRTVLVGFIYVYSLPGFGYTVTTRFNQAQGAAFHENRT